MKNTITFLILFFLVSNISYATVRTVSNIGGSQYGDYYSAYAASVNGDTILIEGTDIQYNWNNGVQWAKSLVVIGIGYNAQKMNTRRTKLTTYIYNDGTPSGFVFANGCNGSKFYGIQFPYTINFNNASLNDLVFEDCYFSSTFSFGSQGSSNIAIRNCVFESDGRDILFPGAGNICNNILISNCIFNGYITGQGNTVFALTVDHCIFLWPNFGQNEGYFQGVYNALIKNSIFMNIPLLLSNNTNTFLNNMSRVEALALPNIGNTNPNFVNYALGNFYTTAWNFQLQAGSLGIGAATDGTDIGIHGGTSNYSEKGEVLITPIVRLLNINNTTVTPGGTINVHIKATKPSDN